MWNALRQAPFEEFHFRRQVPLGPYFADFASHAAKLVVEVDGDTHTGEPAEAYDDRRDWFIRSQGFDIVRVTNRDVMNNLEGVLITVSQRLGPTPTRPLPGPPSPQEGGRSSMPDQTRKNT